MPLPEEPPLWHRFVAGGLGDMTAALVSHPADVLKVRLQLTGECNSHSRSLGFQDFRRAARKLALEEGVRKGLYGGLSASLLRQATFSGLRHGLFGVLDRSSRQHLQSDATANRGGSQAVAASSTVLRLVCALSAGCTAAVIANPCDVVLIRMQADGHWPASERRGYRNVFDGMRQILKQEGVRAFWRGCTPNVTRAALVTGSQVVTYEEAKYLCVRSGLDDGSLAVQLGCAMTSATVACVVTSPVDVVKTRIMNMQSTHGQQYSGPWDCIRRTMGTEGPLAFYKGLSATFLRLWPHTVILWLAQERYNRILRTHFQ
eukprot:TRINITY_DN39581_c0_g1_i1.p1 TRINITY_DN39581_c0_g1~~TRINITY_DN39581_c0_g1_i1.p1  ORF type:complete len:342 (+),score=14.34 TRINITY_DN39581_c0_g1_i1:76-1026(+)